jgi:hypothetical protein
MENTLLKSKSYAWLKRKVKNKLTKSTWDKKSHPCTKCGNLTHLVCETELTDKFNAAPL